MKIVSLALALAVALGFLAPSASAVESNESTAGPLTEHTADIAQPAQALAPESPILACLPEDAQETTVASWDDECFGPYPPLFCQCWQGCCENCKCWAGYNINLCLPDF